MTDPTTTPAKTSRVKVLADATVSADFGRALSNLWRATPEQWADAMERECEDFHSHCRDHRSLDHVRLEVVRVYEQQCSACHCEWETDVVNGKECCASCGAEVSP